MSVALDEVLHSLCISSFTDCAIYRYTSLEISVSLFLSSVRLLGRLHPVLIR